LTQADIPLEEEELDKMETEKEKKR